MIIYVWQNIEVVKTKIEYEHNLKVKNNLIIKNDRVRFEIEKKRTFSQVKKYADKNNLSEITPDNIEVLKVKEKNDK